MYKKLLNSVIAIALICLATAASADWGKCDPMTSVEPLQGGDVLAVDDGNGGGIFLQHDTFYGGDDTIYLTRVDANNNEVFSTSFSESYIRDDLTSLASDNNGGCWVIYRDIVGTKVRGFDSVGTQVGLTESLDYVSNNTDHQIRLSIVSDHNGGAWAGFQMLNPTEDGLDLTLCHLDSYGQEDQRRLVHDYQGDFPVGYKFDMAAHSSGHCYIAFEETDGDSSPGEPNVRVSVFSTDGIGYFGDGMKVVSNSGDANQYNPGVAVLGDGSCVVGFSNGGHLYAQRVHWDFGYIWNSLGKMVEENGSNGAPGSGDLVADGQLGAVFAYRYTGSGTNPDGVRAQRLDSSGDPQWTDENGNPGTMVSNIVGHPKLQFHGNGGAIVSWCDFNNYGLYAEGLDAAGNQLWPDSDHLICDDGWYLAGLFSDGDNGALAVTTDVGIPIGGRVVWDILESTEPDYEVIPGSGKGMMRPEAGIFEITFQWKTYGISNPDHDYVTFTGSHRNHYNCWLEANETITLYPSQYSVSSRCYPAPDGATYHEVSWSRRDCVSQCKYFGTGNSGNGVYQSSPAPFTLDVTFCPQDYEKGGPSFNPATPNPFNPATTLSFYVPEGASNVSLDIFNLRGERVRSIKQAELATGWNEVTWQGRNDRGGVVSSGVYFARLTVDGQIATQKLALMK